MPVTYKDSGVDLDLYAQAMQRLPSLARRTFSPRVVSNDGGFAGLFKLDFSSPLFSRNYEDPILVAGTDGVGTKLKVAQMTGRHDTVGIDLVAMCVNDLICTGAEPLFFLDYIAMGRDDADRLEQVVKGISDGCLQADSALLGGETAIMPDMYAAEDYDLAGFAVGVVDRKHLVDGKSIVPGDKIIGISSDGIHSNGYSLVRKIISHAGIALDACPAELGGASVADELLRPTRIYSSMLRRVLGHYRVKHVVHGIAHITGGGLHENLSRILPKTVDTVIQPDSWPMPPVFPWLQGLGDVADDEMQRVFNMGLGLVLVVSDFYAAKIMELVRAGGCECTEIGHVEAGSGESRFA
ncbi:MULTISPECIES: phosphoribosylformylglycinamidine cyclo-ligase [Rosistilla]|uniref:Phosphoribosylformylglycinamidine cyclo-ligase n=2 Tax=Rosistilla TaxID=2795779 RepID=A0A518J2C4_9BACT|nr:MULTISPECIES: phosphoribosylformylglycinamidine cyclo-ligase [Rosistilla]QDS91074.1 Phosphoribosylformylglycinamidine cyclo-ligase [Rosistilla ulvae]QDV59483.1 Phosphoribosylformylglycinamidine cyclo-ligase [Rosistilla oblonga]